MRGLSTLCFWFVFCTSSSLFPNDKTRSWHPWRRKYNLFLSRFRSGAQEFDQFAEIDEGLWAWSFLVSDRASVRGSIAREFGGFGREIFTDTGRYVIRFDAVQQGVPDGRKEGEMTVLPPKADGEKGLTLDERAVMLATAISSMFPLQAHIKINLL